MPVIKRIGPYEFRFYVCGEAMERPHIHVWRDRNTAKFWLDVVSCASRQGYANHELTRIERLVEQHRDEFMEDIEATSLFSMTRPSAESPASIQRWLDRRNKIPEEARFEAAERQLAEQKVDYSATP